ncbi:uncharacterized protein K441DRAFT_680896 [Cenococcum geophilum 1.58]|uniref:uncharacterized protein n=1 Tax=Cenococcum geophilum 1.58 TaxID=794803 RepID=UPI00358E8CDA|nr:hypothetical protein K441DRAFT_680896 [Cenococcum geophilum 1.58]
MAFAAFQAGQLATVGESAGVWHRQYRKRQWWARVREGLDARNQRVTVWSAQFSDRGWAVGCCSARVSSGTISAGRMATAASNLGGAGGVWRQQHNEIASDRRKSKVFHLEHEEMGQRPAAFAMLF